MRNNDNLVSYPATLLYSVMSCMLAWRAGEFVATRTMYEFNALGQRDLVTYVTRVSNLEENRGVLDESRGCVNADFITLTAISSRRGGGFSLLVPAGPLEPMSTELSSVRSVAVVASPISLIR